MIFERRLLTNIFFLWNSRPQLLGNSTRIYRLTKVVLRLAARQCLDVGSTIRTTTTPVPRNDSSPTILAPLESGSWLWIHTTSIPSLFKFDQWSGQSNLRVGDIDRPHHRCYEHLAVVLQRPVVILSNSSDERVRAQRLTTMSIRTASMFSPD